MTAADTVDAAVAGLWIALGAYAVWCVARMFQQRRRRHTWPPYATFQPSPPADADPVPGHWARIVTADCEACGVRAPHQTTGDGTATCINCRHTIYTTDQE